MKNPLFVIIDTQNDFINENGVYAQKHIEITHILKAKSSINKLLKEIPAENIVIITSDYIEEQFSAGVSMCIPNTWGHQIDIEVSASHTLITKTEHSCFTSTAFCNYLKNNDIKELILCGFLAEYCVKQSAIDALNLGYQVSLKKNCIATGDDVSERCENMLNDLEKLGAKII